MKYILMCGGVYSKWAVPRQMVRIGQERVIERTIRLLRENGVTDIAISTNNPIFKIFGLPILKHMNNYNPSSEYEDCHYWCEAFYPTDEPTCYIFGDVVFSPEAIKKIVKTKTKDIQFFASAPPFAEAYQKPWAEPFALKVVNTDRFKKCIDECKRLQDEGAFKRNPIMWELWQIIKGTEYNVVDYTNYCVINDYTCDVDDPKDIGMFSFLN